MKPLPRNIKNYLKGLLGVFENANSVALSLVSRCSYDSLTRVLNDQKLGWQTLLLSFVTRTFGRLQAGWLIIDDTIISKQFAKRIENLAWIFDSKVGRSILGLQLVLIVWTNGVITLPLAIRVYQKSTGKSKIDLACELLRFAKRMRIKPKYVTFDSWYAATKILLLVRRFRWNFVCRLKKNRKLDGTPLRETKRCPYWIKVGKLANGLKVLVVRNGKKYFAASNLSLSKKELLQSYRGRWNIETVFKALHSNLGLDECQARKLSAQVAHFHLCLMAYTVPENESFIRKKTIYQIKRLCSFNFEHADLILDKLIFKGA